MNKVVLLVMAMAMTACCSQKTHQSAQQPIPNNPARLSGGYSAQRPINNIDKKVFARATADLDGVCYTPKSVATQVVAGKNYKFICTAHPVTLSSEPFEAEIIVFEPLPCNGEEPRITAIHRLDE